MKNYKVDIRDLTAQQPSGMRVAALIFLQWQSSQPRKSILSLVSWTASVVRTNFCA